MEGIDPFLARRIGEWFEKSPPRISPPEIREEFLTLTRARRALAEHPKIDVKIGLHFSRQSCNGGRDTSGGLDPTKYCVFIEITASIFGQAGQCAESVTAFARPWG
jgi:hypothetical protein